MYGLIGYPLKHSFSKRYFSDKNIEYENFEIEYIEQVRDILSNPNIKGLNVTIPYKEKVISYLDEIDDIVKEIGACNTIEFKEGKTIGHNTDIIGFEKSVENYLGFWHTHALILGTGGASKAIEYVLKKNNLIYKFVSRTPKEDQLSYSDLAEDIMKQYTVIINCTPLGTYPKLFECPNILYQYITKDHFCYDLVYNPEKTEFLHQCELQGAQIKNGYEMLQIQAEESLKTWTNI